MTQGERVMVRKVLHLPTITGNPYNRLITDNLEKYGYRVLDLKGSPGSPLSLLTRTGDAEVIHFHWIKRFSSSRWAVWTVKKSLVFIFVLFVMRLSGKKLVITLHNLVPHQRGKRQIDIFTRKFNLKLFDAVIVHSRAAQDHASAIFGIGSKTVLIPHPNYRKYYEQNITREKAREYFGLDQDVVVLLFFGQIRADKQIETLMKLFSGEQGRNLYLIVAGKDKVKNDGVHSGMLERDNVIIHDKFIPDNMVQYYFRSADATIHPSSSFSALTSGSAVLSVSFGIPIIAAEHVPFKDFFEDGLGVPCDLKTPGSLETAIARILGWDRKEYAAKCERYLDQTDPVEVARLHAELYDRFIDSNKVRKGGLKQS